MAITACKIESKGRGVGILRTQNLSLQNVVRLFYHKMGIDKRAIKQKLSNTT